MIKNKKYSAITFFLLLFVSCKSAQVVSEKTEVPDAIVDKYNEFYSKPNEPDEVFRVLLSSEFYEIRQTAYEDILYVKDDPAGNQMTSEELEQYNKVDYFGRAVLKIELYSKTGKLARLRFLRSSGISEIDRLISEDITRWHFKFQEGVKEEDLPDIIIVVYGIVLEKNISREEAVEELKKYVR
ncbi:MAG: hypothetical protein OEZ22_10065 [Spirochaetia bacterium]|nr:hypothetical protein [Spirochaetia bacterium]